MNNVLNVNFPPIATYMVETPILSILSTDDKYIPWLVCNFTQMNVKAFLKMKKTGISMESGLSFNHPLDESFSCPYFETRHIESESVKSDIIDFLRTSINDGYYVVTVIDTFYISLYPNYQKRHVNHPIFIYGYNDKQNEFMVSDFFNRIYCFKSALYNEIKIAFVNCDNDYWIQGVRLLKRINYKYDFHIDYYRVVLNNYLAGVTEKVKEVVASGLDATYSMVKYEISRLMSENKYYDNRVVPILFEHKKVLEIAVDYLISIGYKSLHDEKEQIACIKNDTMILRNKIIMREIKKGKLIDSTITEDIKARERIVIESILNKILLPN